MRTLTQPATAPTVHEHTLTHTPHTHKIVSSSQQSHTYTQMNTDTHKDTVLDRL